MQIVPMCTLVGKHSVTKPHSRPLPFTFEAIMWSEIFIAEVLRRSTGQYILVFFPLYVVLGMICQ
jgi:hypothetical protein